jgi:methyl-accepting chemotaxis protein
MLLHFRLLPRMAAAVGVPIALMLAAALAAGWQLQRIGVANAALEAGRLQRETVSQWIGHVHVNLDKAMLATRLDAAVGDSDDARERMAAPMGWLNETMSATAAAAAKANETMAGDAGTSDPKITEFVAQVSKDRARFVAVRSKIRDDLLLGEGQPRIEGELVPLAKAMRNSLDQLQAHIGTQAKAASQNLAADVRRAQTILALSCLLALASGAWLAWRLARSVVQPIDDAVRFAHSIAAGNLTVGMTAHGADETATLQRALLAMRDALGQLVGQVRTSADSIRVASDEVASGNADLSHRTEVTASNLQQTASSMEQLTGTVRQSGDSAAQANRLASSAASVAQRGGVVVAQVVSTMEEINRSSKRIADIIGTIDGIAFQTNILALNAAVEAARAGEQGRGFAVVASEVRSLAQRSAEAAREIKALIGASVDRVEAGTRLVGEAGSTMTEIVASVQRVTDIIGEISAAAGEQTQGIGQVNSAVNELDRMTQQNAALVEESAAAAESLRQQAERLGSVVSRFDLAQNADRTPV